MALQFLHDIASGDGDIEDLRIDIGGKATSLVRIIRANPEYAELVPQGFVVSCGNCASYLASGQLDPELEVEILDALRQLETRTGRRLGDPADPLLVSVRSGAALSMPGLMTTVLNVGLSPGEVSCALRDRYSQTVVERMMVQLLQGLAEVIPATTIPALHTQRSAQTTYLPSLWHSLERRFREEVDLRQHDRVLLRCIRGVFDSWNSDRATAVRHRDPELAALHGTAVLVQQMRLGVADDPSGSGVLFSRHPATGEKVFFTQYAQHQQGDVIVSGLRRGMSHEEFVQALPELAARLESIAMHLERTWRNAVDIEFTIESGTLFLLECRAASLSGPGMLHAVLDMLAETAENRLQITLSDAVEILQPDHFERSMFRCLMPQAHDSLIAEGERGGAGVATGRVVFSPGDALSQASDGYPVILVTEATSPDDVPGMIAAAGYVTHAGGALAHAALMARKLRKPAVVGVAGLRIDRLRNLCEFTNDWGTSVEVHAGSVISIDGTRGKVYLGQVQEGDIADLGDIETTAARLQGYYEHSAGAKRLEVYVNADSAEEIQRGLQFGANGVGLVRTEAMQKVEEQLKTIRSAVRMMEPMADRDLDLLEHAHFEDFVEILKEASTTPPIPIAIRLLDDTGWTSSATRREPTLTGPVDIFAMSSAKLGGFDTDLEREVGDSLPHHARGVRIAMIHEPIYRRQIRALFDAVAETKAVHTPLDLIIPMVIDSKEVELVQKMVAEELLTWRAGQQAQWAKQWTGPALNVMIETPRAAVLGGEIAERVDRFSLGTNDLTQMVLGLDRDDVGGHVMSCYFNRGILASNPFAVLDCAVQVLVRYAVEQIRAVKPSARFTASGEHASEKDAVSFFRELEIDVLSVSPDEVPVAWLLLAKGIRSGPATLAQPVKDVEEA